ncbi:hypothetical protein AAG570_012114 [Ranatra chinensis]|uniref:Uncharacterized protein n=1 Tax=Ranatra chinensis TaxID=642074 RepID=A0ABD0Z055_9HEMI
MASKRRNMFQKNKTQQTTENETGMPEKIFTITGFHRFEQTRDGYDKLTLIQHTRSARSDCRTDGSGTGKSNQSQIKPVPLNAASGAGLPVATFFETGPESDALLTENSSRPPSLQPAWWVQGNERGRTECLLVALRDIEVIIEALLEMH